MREFIDQDGRLLRLANAELAKLIGSSAAQLPPRCSKTHYLSARQPQDAFRPELLHPTIAAVEEYLRLPVTESICSTSGG